VKNAAIQLRGRWHMPHGGGVLHVHFHDRSPAGTQRTSPALHAFSMPKKKLITRRPLAL
jgi:hypothetical protein